MKNQSVNENQELAGESAELERQPTGHTPGPWRSTEPATEADYKLWGMSKDALRDEVVRLRAELKPANEGGYDAKDPLNIGYQDGWNDAAEQAAEMVDNYGGLMALAAEIRALRSTK